MPISVLAAKGWACSSKNWSRPSSPESGSGLIRQLLRASERRMVMSGIELMKVRVVLWITSVPHEMVTLPMT